MSNVVELPPSADWAKEVPGGYRVRVLDCLRCWRDFRVCVATDDRAGSLLVVDVPCPHCHRWVAETIVPPVSRVVFVQACTRSWLAWRVRGAQRGLRLARAYTRFGIEWPYWAARRLIRRVSGAKVGHGESGKRSRVEESRGGRPTSG